MPPRPAAAATHNPEAHQQPSIAGTSGRAAGASGGATVSHAAIGDSMQQKQSALPSVAPSAATSAHPALNAVKYVRTAAEMKQLEAKLLAIPCWGFAVSLDSDAGPIASVNALQGAEWKVPDPKARPKKTGSGSTAAAQSDSLHLLDEEEQTQQGPQQQHVWRWSVLGVAFSMGDNEAYYVPLLSSGKSSKAAGLTDVTQRSSTSPRLHQLWEGIRRIFTANSSPSAGRAGGIPAIRAAGDAINAALAAVPEAGAPLAVPAEAAPKQWLDPGPVKVTYALKHQLALLAQPPAASGLRGFVMAEPLVDVRLAAWLLEPDKEDLLGEDKHGLRPGQK